MAWSHDEVKQIGDAEELQLASTRVEGGVSTYTTMWVVRVGDDLYVRSAGGPNRPWYRRAMSSGSGRIRAGSIERDVTFGEVDSDSQSKIDSAYHAKYDRYGQNIVGHVVGPKAHSVTIRLLSRPVPD